jgi:hypothetical protein
MAFIHKNLAGGRWNELSLAEQMGNIGSEVSRANNWKNKNKEIFDGAVERALELFDLTLDDPRWLGRRREINRAREVFCDAISGGKEYGGTLESLGRYFDFFALAANAKK